MAQSEHLPIYKASYDLCLYFEQAVRNFSRYDKYAARTPAWLPGVRTGADHEPDAGGHWAD